MKNRRDPGSEKTIENWGSSPQSLNAGSIPTTTIANRSNHLTMTLSPTCNGISPLHAKTHSLMSKDTCGETVVTLALSELDISRYRLHYWPREHSKSALKIYFIATPPTGGSGSTWILSKIIPEVTQAN